MKDLSFFLSLFLFYMLSAEYVQAIELKTAAQDSAPKYFVNEDHSMAGLCVDILRAIERTDPEIKFSGYDHFLPFNRIQKQLEDGVLDVFLGFKRTPARLGKYHFIDIPLYQLDYKLAALSVNGFGSIRLEDISTFGPEMRVLTINGSAAVNFLKEQNLGFVVDDSARSPENMILMLKHGRARLAFYHDLSLFFVLDHMDAGKDIEVLPRSFTSYSHYLAFSKQARPEAVARVTKALRKLSESGDLGRISARYKLFNHDQTQSDSK